MAQLTIQPDKAISQAELRVIAEGLRAEFTTLEEAWRRDTMHLSRVSQKVAHPAYQRIIRMGEGVVPLLLEALRDRPAHWFVALKATAHVDPASVGMNPKDARESWLEWGRREGLVE